MKHVVMFSGGICSWAAARRVSEKHGTADLILLFADTKIEDEDSYRFLEEGAKDVGGELVRIADGRDPWQVFKDVRFLGNSRLDPCSRVLKRDLCDKWMRDHFKPDECRVYLGLDWTEIHRAERAAGRWMPYTAESPMCDKPYMTKMQMIASLATRGIKPPRLYAMGFSHANCGGFCIKAGHGHFATLLRELPARYRYHEGKEQELREHLGADVSILKDRTGGVAKPMTLKTLRERIEARGEVDMFDIGGCGCFNDEEDK